MTQGRTSNPDAVELKNITLKRGDRLLWKKINLTIQPGEFVAVLGPNGTGKTSLLKVLLGLLPQSEGAVSILGDAPHKGNPHIGYIPQQKGFDPDIPIRGRDLVQLGLTGFRYGFGLGQHHDPRVDEAIEAVDATAYADMPIGLLSGGEQQRLRIAQALVSKPKILLCDEPLLSLDVTSQQTVTKLINDYREREYASVIFVTHEINPILSYVDNILYLAAGHWTYDKPSVVMRSDVLSRLYGTPIEVVRIKGRTIIFGIDTPDHIHGGTA